MAITETLYDKGQGLFKSALRPPQVVDLSTTHGEFRLRVVENQQAIHDGTGVPTGPVTVPMWGYQGKGVTFCSPGPAFLVQQGQPTTITWENALPGAPKGQTIFPYLFQVPLPPYLEDKIPNLKADIITHLHGAAVPSSSDGWPTECYEPGHQRTHHYTNQQPAATIWYHDHAMDQTGLNVYAGVAGGYVILDQADTALSKYLSSLGGNGAGWAETFGHGPAGIPLVIQDRLLSDDGKHFVYQTNFDDAKNSRGVSVGTGGEFFGRANLVNGQISPHLAVGPTAVRLKLLNGCNSRFLVLCFTDDQDRLVKVPAYLIGDDHGRRSHANAVLVGDAPIRLGPGERLDMVADLSGFRGRKIHLVDIGSAPFGADIPEMPTPETGLDGQLVMDRLTVKRNHPKALDGNGNPTTTYNNYPEILLFDIADVAPAQGVDIARLNQILLTGNAVRTRVIALREFIMYMEHPSMQDYVERCPADSFNNMMAHKPSTMLVLEELAPAAAGEPVVLTAEVDLFNLDSPTGIFHYKVVGNTAGTLDASYHNGVLRYRGDMANAWLDNPYTVRANDTEIWRFVNLTGDTHPMHLHLVGFGVVSSCQIDLGTRVDQDGVVSGLRVTSQQVAPDLPAHLLGFKDTVQVDPHSILTVAGTFKGGSGRYVYHCHMLEHEDHMMMRKFKVIP